MKKNKQIEEMSNIGSIVIEKVVIETVKYRCPYSKKLYDSEDELKEETSKDFMQEILEHRTVDWHNEHDELLTDSCIAFLLKNREKLNDILDWNRGK